MRLFFTPSRRPAPVLAILLGTAVASSFLLTALPARGVSHVATWFVFRVPHSVPDRDPAMPFLVNVIIQANLDDTELWAYRHEGGTPVRVLHTTLQAGEASDLAAIEDTRGRTYTVIASRPVAVRVDKVAANRSNASYAGCVDGDTLCVDCHADLVPSPHGGDAGKDFYLYPATNLIDGGVWILAHENAEVRIFDRTLDPSETSPLETWIGSGIHSIHLGAGTVATEMGRPGENYENLLDFYNLHHPLVPGRENLRDKRGHALHVVSTGIVSIIEGATESGPASWFAPAGPDPSLPGGGMSQVGLGVGTSFVLPIHVVHHTHHAIDSPRKTNAARIFLFSFEDRPVQVRVSDIGGPAPLPISTASPSLSLPTPGPPGSVDGDAAVFTIPPGGWIELQSDQSRTLLPMRGDSRCYDCMTPESPCYYANGALDNCIPGELACERCVPPSELGTPDYEYALWRIAADGRISVQKGARATVGCFGSLYFGPQGADCTDPTAIRPEDAWLCDECDTFYRCQHDWLDPDCPLPDCDHRVFCLDPVKEMADRVYSSGAWAASLEGENRRFRVFVPDDVGRYFRVLDRPWLGPAGKVHFVVGGAYDGTGVDVWDIGFNTDPSVSSPRTLLWAGTVGAGEARDLIEDGVDLFDRAVEVIATAPVTVWAHTTTEHFDNDPCRREGETNTFAYADAVPPRLEASPLLTVTPDCPEDRLEGAIEARNTGARPAWNFVSRTLLPAGFGTLRVEYGCEATATADLDPGGTATFPDGTVVFRTDEALVLARATGSEDDGDALPEDPALYHAIDPDRPSSEPLVDAIPDASVFADPAANSFRIRRSSDGLAGWNRPSVAILPGLDPADALPSDNRLCYRFGGLSTPNLPVGTHTIRWKTTWSHSRFVAAASRTDVARSFVHTRPEMASEKRWTDAGGAMLEFTVAARNVAPPGGAPASADAHDTVVTDDLAAAGLAFDAPVVWSSTDGGATWVAHDAVALGWWNGGVLRVRLADVGLGEIAPGGEVLVRFRARSLDPGTPVCQRQRAIWTWERCADPQRLESGEPCPVLTKSAVPACGSVLAPGDRIRYRLEVTNGGTRDATAVVVTDRVPAGTELVPGSAGSAEVRGDLLVWSWQAIEPGASVAGSFEVTVTACCADIVNRATVSCAEVAPWTTPDCTHTVSESVPPVVEITFPHEECYPRELTAADILATATDDCTLPGGLGLAESVVPVDACSREARADATDECGNRGSDSVRFVVDTHPPAGTITNIREGACYGREFAPGDVQADWTDDCTPVPDLVRTTDVRRIDNCNREALAEATDCGGNRGTTSVRFVSDTHPPTVRITSPIEGDCYGREFQPSEIAVDWSDDCTPVPDLAKSVTIVPLDACLREARAEATDCGGNRGNDAVRYVSDTTPPVVDLLVPDGSLLCTEPTLGNVAYTVTDDCTAVSSIGLVLRRTPIQPAICLERLTLEATDCGGNTGSDSAEAIVDLEPPRLDCEIAPILRCVGDSNCEGVDWEAIQRHCRITDCTEVRLVPGSFDAEILTPTGTVVCRDGKGGCRPGETKPCAVFLYDERVFLHKDPHAKPGYQVRIGFDVADECGHVSRGALLYDVVHDTRSSGPCNPGGKR